MNSYQNRLNCFLNYLSHDLAAYLFFFLRPLDRLRLISDPYFSRFYQNIQIHTKYQREPKKNNKNSVICKMLLFELLYDLSTRYSPEDIEKDLVCAYSRNSAPENNKILGDLTLSDLSFLKYLPS